MSQTWLMVKAHLIGQELLHIVLLTSYHTNQKEILTCNSFKLKNEVIDIISYIP